MEWSGKRSGQRRVEATVIGNDELSDTLGQAVHDGHKMRANLEGQNGGVDNAKTSDAVLMEASAHVRTR
jgi:hypothetical protein